MDRDAILNAVEQTLRLAREHEMDNCTDEDCPHLDYKHLVNMQQQMQADPFMDLGKMNRWLGWIQAAVNHGTIGGVDLDSLRSVNGASVALRLPDEQRR